MKLNYLSGGRMTVGVVVGPILQRWHMFVLKRFVHKCQHNWTKGHKLLVKAVPSLTQIIPLHNKTKQTTVACMFCIVRLIQQMYFQAVISKLRLCTHSHLSAQPCYQRTPLTGWLITGNYHSPGNISVYPAVAVIPPNPGRKHTCLDYTPTREGRHINN